MNLYHIGGGFGGGNWIEFPPELTGVEAKIIGILGKWFPVGAHKVGAVYGCLVPRLVSGNYDPTTQKAVWPSTGNYCRGGAYDCALLVPRLVSGNYDPTTQKAVWPSTGNYCRGGAYDCALLECPAIAILPEGMSRERFEWLQEIQTDEIIATPGTESNVKEIYERCWELRRERGEKDRHIQPIRKIWELHLALSKYRLHYRRDL